MMPTCEPITSNVFDLERGFGVKDAGGTALHDFAKKLWDSFPADTASKAAINVVKNTEAHSVTKASFERPALAFVNSVDSDQPHNESVGSASQLTNQNCSKAPQSV